MKKKNVQRAIAMVATVAMALPLAACGGSSQTASGTAQTSSAAATTGSETTVSGAVATDPNAIVVKYSVTYPSSGTQADGAKALAELISQESAGKMKMEFYPSSQLGDKSATFEGLQGGTIEMTECAATDLSSFDDIWSVFSLPYLWENGAQAVQVVQDSSVKDILEKSAEEAGFKIIAWTDMGSRSFLNDTRTVNTPKDLNGLKIRCMEDKVLAETTNALGAIGTPMAASEVYTGLQQGTLDGLDHTPSVIVSNGWEELCKYYSLTEHFTIPDPVFVSKMWFDGLSKENQDALVKAGEEFTQKWNNEIWPNATEEGLSEMKAAGVEITEVDKTPFIEAAQPVVDEFLKGASENQKNLYDLLESTKKNY